MTKVIPKRWTVSAIATLQAPLTIRCNNVPFDQGAPGALGTTSPVELLLISIASCFALSLRMAMVERHLDLQSFSVFVEATTAPTLPSHLEGLELQVQLPGTPDAERDSLVRRAKELCTVTNTLARAPALRVFAGENVSAS
jgi:uncharacterized OsmC-like protein